MTVRRPGEQIRGWQVPGVTAENTQTLVDGFATGNAALRTPFIGYDPNSGDAENPQGFVKLHTEPCMDFTSAVKSRPRA